MTHPNITPGLWHLGKRAGKRAIYGEKGEEIALPLGFFMEEEEALANARAIAALPALLDALHSILYAADSPPGASLGEAKLCRHFKDKARAALAAAGYQF